MAGDDSGPAGRYRTAVQSGTHDARNAWGPGDARRCKDCRAVPPDVSARRRLRATGRGGEEILFRPSCRRKRLDGILMAVVTHLPTCPFWVMSVGPARCLRTAYVWMCPNSRHL